MPWFILNYQTEAINFSLQRGASFIAVRRGTWRGWQADRSSRRAFSDVYVLVSVTYVIFMNDHRHDKYIFYHYFHIYIMCWNTCCFKKVIQTEWHLLNIRIIRGFHIAEWIFLNDENDGAISTDVIFTNTLVFFAFLDTYVGMTERRPQFEQNPQMTSNCFVSRIKL